jgi:hypothetical protein
VISPHADRIGVARELARCGLLVMLAYGLIQLLLPGFLNLARGT